MGSVFGFVSSDVKSKVEILEEFRKQENANKFETFKLMLNFEKNEGLFKKNDYVSGSRTLLRLHRGLSEYNILNVCIFKIMQHTYLIIPNYSINYHLW